MLAKGRGELQPRGNGKLVHTVTVSTSGLPTVRLMVRWTCTSVPARRIVQSPDAMAENGIPLQHKKSQQLSLLLFPALISRPLLGGKSSRRT